MGKNTLSRLLRAKSVWAQRAQGVGNIFLQQRDQVDQASQRKGEGFANLMGVPTRAVF